MFSILQNIKSMLKQINYLSVDDKVQQKLDSFYTSKKIPHIIFHGASGTGKKTIVHNFLCKIYENDKTKMKTNIMFVNCSHGKGIKFIREELKFFAKFNIQSNNGVLFKSIVLLNADYLTIDAQSALRRCIELFSNTRFFIIVENKHKLLNPILSRFCEIHIPEYRKTNGEVLNLHQYNLNNVFSFENFELKHYTVLNEKMNTTIIPKVLNKSITHKDLADFSTEIYDLGYSALDLVEYFKKCNDNNDKKTAETVMCFHKIKAEYRCEKMLMFYLLDFAYLRTCSQGLKSIGFL